MSAATFLVIVPTFFALVALGDYAIDRVAGNIDKPSTRALFAISASILFGALSGMLCLALYEVMT